MNDSETTRSRYWNDFYRTKAASLAAPSQFALFVLGETETDSQIVDLGCGTGRDAIYFASQGRHVVGVDAADAAIAHCSKIAADNGLPARFLASAIDAPDLLDRISREFDGTPRAEVTVYARFFVHAINDEEEAALLRLAAGLCRKGGAVGGRVPYDSRCAAGQGYG